MLYDVFVTGSTLMNYNTIYSKMIQHLCFNQRIGCFSYSSGSLFHYTFNYTSTVKLWLGMSFVILVTISLSVFKTEQQYQLFPVWYLLLNGLVFGLGAQEYFVGEKRRKRRRRRKVEGRGTVCHLKTTTSEQVYQVKKYLPI